MLTKRQLKRIEEIIKKRFLVFTYETLGEDALSEEELDLLKRTGLLRESVRNFVGDAYTLGKIAALVERETARAVSYDDVLRIAKKMQIQTGVEKKAVQYAKEHAGEYIKGLRDDMIKEVRASSARVGSEAVRAVQNKVAEAIENRNTVSQLKTELFHAVDDRNRDWQRVANTEMQASIQNGIYSEIVEAFGSEQLVYKRPAPDACKHCLRLHLDEDGVPRIFPLSSLAASNVGLKANAWRATIGPVHPWCQCQLHMVPAGYGFVKQNIAATKFTFMDVEYRPGVVIPKGVFDVMPESFRGKTRTQAILEPGGVARPTVRKSLDLSDTANNEDLKFEY
jgi:hypothetical protein